MAARNSNDLQRDPRAIVALRELHAGAVQKHLPLADYVATLTA